MHRVLARGPRVDAERVDPEGLPRRARSAPSTPQPCRRRCSAPRRRGTAPIRSGPARQSPARSARRGARRPRVCPLQSEAGVSAQRSRRSITAHGATNCSAGMSVGVHPAGRNARARRWDPVFRVRPGAHTTRGAEGRTRSSPRKGWSPARARCRPDGWVRSITAVMQGDRRDLPGVGSQTPAVHTSGPARHLG